MFFLSKKKTDDKEAEEVVHVVPKGPPTFLPLENMVVNLADPGGEKVAQVGVTLELSGCPVDENGFCPVEKFNTVLNNAAK